MLATEKKVSSILVDEDSMERIVHYTGNVGVVYSGMGPDFRVLVRKGQKKAQAYALVYGENIPVLELVREIAGIMQEFTQSGGVRPFGVSLLIAGYDDEGPQLYQVDPSGAYFGWKASSIGKNFTNAKTFLEKVRGNRACVYPFVCVCDIERGASWSPTGSAPSCATLLAAWSSCSA